MQAELTSSDHDPIRVLLARWKADPNATYRTWFLWEDRLKNFRSIRRGIGQVIAEIDAGTFGNARSPRRSTPRSSRGTTP